MIPSRRSHSRLRSASSHVPVQTAPTSHSTHSRVNAPTVTRSRSHSQSEAVPTHYASSRPHNTTPNAKPRGIFFGKAHQPYYDFTTFSTQHSINYKRQSYPSVQHLYQASKFFDHRPDIAERVRRCSSPAAAVAEAEQYKALMSPNWANTHISFLDECFYLKFIQHEELMRELLSTGDTELFENSTNDGYWSAGDSGTGRNELGKSVQRVRKRIREEAVAGVARSIPSSSKTRWAGPLPQSILKSSSSSSTPLCHVCQERPQADPASQVCGYSCGVKALSHRFPLCDFCHTAERQYGKPYCSQTCAFKLMDKLGSKTDIPCYNCSRKAKGPGIFCRDCKARAQQPNAGTSDAPKRSWSTVVNPPHSNRQSLV